MKCPKCQAENPESIKFCGECGTQLIPPVEAQPSFTKTIETLHGELATGSIFADRYQVIEELGKGGMGKVYRVFDKKLNEEVALKLIKPEIASDKTTLERFKNELRLARKISQKNVGRMFDLGEEAGSHYITMEYVPGEDLKSFVRRSGQLAVGTTIRIAKQICEGLSEAHRTGVIHRDLKPSNIMIDKQGNAKILDFGIARSLKGSSITGAGVIIGTPEYMSPEQVEGKETDQRSDIYSIGVILFEMLTGRLPFEGDTPLAVAVLHKSEAPPDPREFNPQIPEKLARIILQCLEKEKNSRPQSAEEVLASLGEIEGESSTAGRPAAAKRPHTSKELTVTLGIKKPFLAAAIAVVVIAAALLTWKLLPKREVPKASIAVISFENQTGESSYDYLKEAIPNLLITSLERSKHIEVMTWERMHDLLVQMGQSGVDVIDRDLGFELCRRDGIKAIVLGSFVMAGDMFATDVKVLDVSTKSILKSASSRGEGVASILKSQIDELSREISKGISGSVSLFSPLNRRIADVTTDSMEAYELFLKGKERFDKFYFAEARRDFERALELDPKFAMAYYYLGEAYIEVGERDPGIEAYLKAHEFSDKATEKEKLFIESQYANWSEGDSEKRLKILQELVEKYPKEKQAYSKLGDLYMGRQMYKEAINSYSKAVELDPNWGYVVNSLGYAYSDTGDYQKAIQCFEKYAELSPGDANPIDSMAEQNFRMGRLDEAILKYKQALAIKPDFDSGLALALVYAFKMDYVQAQTQLDSFIAETASSGKKAEGYLWKGMISFLAGQRDRAFVFLAESKKLGDRIRSASADYVRAWMYYDMGGYDLSRTYLQAAADVFLSFFSSPGWECWAEFCRGLIDVRQGELDSARSRLETIKAILPKLKTPRSIKINSLRRDWLRAEILMAQGSPEEAVTILENTKPVIVPNLQTDVYAPYNLPFKRDFLARAYLKSGRIDEAVAEYERLTTFVPGEKDWHLVNPVYYLELGKLYEERQMAGKAVKSYERFLELWKDADPGLPEVEDARTRLAGLKGS